MAVLRNCIKAILEYRAIVYIKFPPGCRGTKEESLKNHELCWYGKKKDSIKSEHTIDVT